jgi:prepilin-type N-terminal cleavage/methylation domain-containing protein
VHIRSRRGFTLIELLIVVVIIGILAAIAIPKFANTKEKAYLAAMKSDLRNIVTAQETYFADQTTYTTSTTALNLIITPGVSLSIGTATTGGWSATASHTATTRTCGIYVGTVSPPIAGQNEGEPRCQ